MRAPRNFFGSISIAALLFASLSFHGASPVRAEHGQSGEPTLLFAVSAFQLPTTEIVPFVIIDQGQFKAPVAGDSDADELTKFSDTYYKKGTKYRVLFGGGEAGAITIKKSNKDGECSKSGAEATIKTTAKLNNNVMALATNSTSLGASTGTRRAPTPAERATLMPLVKAAYKAKGLPAALLPSLVTVNLTAIDLDNDGKAELIGSFVAKKVKGGAARYAMFLIAEPKGYSYNTTVLQYEVFLKKDIMSGAEITVVEQGVYLERLIDGLNVDGDAGSEVITITQGLEGDGYHIYKKQGGTWKQVYEFSNYRCAF